MKSICYFLVKISKEEGFEVGSRDTRRSIRAYNKPNPQGRERKKNEGSEPSLLLLLVVVVVVVVVVAHSLFLM